MARIARSLAVVSILLAAALVAPAGASAHRNPCHTKHTCLSDHHTYRYKGLLCTSYEAERKASDKIVLKVAGRRYWCQR